MASDRVLAALLAQTRRGDSSNGAVDATCLIEVVEGVAKAVIVYAQGGLLASAHARSFRESLSITEYK